MFLISERFWWIFLPPGQSQLSFLCFLFLPTGDLKIRRRLVDWRSWRQKGQLRPGVRWFWAAATVEYRCIYVYIYMYMYIYISTQFYIYLPQTIVLLCYLGGLTCWVCCKHFWWRGISWNVQPFQRLNSPMAPSVNMFRDHNSSYMLLLGCLAARLLMLNVADRQLCVRFIVQLSVNKIWRFPEMEVPPNHPSHQTILVLKAMTWRSLHFQKLSQIQLSFFKAKVYSQAAPGTGANTSTSCTSTSCTSTSWQGGLMGLMGLV